MRSARRRGAWAAAAGLVALLCGGALAVGDVGAAFAAGDIDAALRKQVKDADSFKRSDAARALAGIGNADAARLLLELLEDRSPYVRDHTVTACDKVKDDAAVGVLCAGVRTKDELLRRNLAEAIGRTNNAVGLAVLQNLAHKDASEAVRASALDALWGHKGSDDALAICEAPLGDKSALVRGAAAEAAGRLRAAKSVMLTEQALADADEGVRCVARMELRFVARDHAVEDLAQAARAEGWRTRAQVVENALWLQDAEALDALVLLVGDDNLRVAAAAHRALMALSGKDLDRDRDLWQSWWKQNRETWKRPGKLSKRAESAGDEKRTRAEYHGVEVTSDSVVFVLDASGSMKNDLPGTEGTRWEKAREELESTLASMPDGSHVNVIVFQHKVKTAFKSPQPLGKKTRRDAASFLRKITPGQAGNLLGGMMAALDQEADTIFLLSDGAPSFGDIVDKRRVRNAIRQRNRMLKRAIHAIGFGSEKRSERNFMDGLARDSGGVAAYR